MWFKSPTGIWRWFWMLKQVWKSSGICSHRINLMEFTQKQLEEEAGYRLQAAPEDAWRTYDERNPMPGYFQFDWLSARHTDLYHKFALSRVGRISVTVYGKRLTQRSPQSHEGV
jgi:hypothetical protein